MTSLSSTRHVASDQSADVSAHSKSALLAASKQSEDGRILHSALERLFHGIQFGMTSAHRPTAGNLNPSHSIIFPLQKPQLFH
jgi:hypothetical protein